MLCVQACCSETSGHEVALVPSEPGQKDLDEHPEVGQAMITSSTDTTAAADLSRVSEDQLPLPTPLEPPEPEKPPQDARPLAPVAAVAAELAREPQYTWEVAVVKGEAGIGVDLSPHDGVTLLLGKVKPGPLQQWNDQQAVDSPDRITRGDRIVAANGVSGDSTAVLNVMRSQESLTFTMRRLLDFAIAVTREAGEALGLTVVDTPSGKTLLIRRVSEGPVEVANRRNGAEMELRYGDEIAQVNGVSGSAAELLGILAVATDLYFQIRRPIVANGSGDSTELGELQC